MNYKEELNDLIKIVAQEGASDLHISEGRNPIIRVTGLLLPLVKKPVLDSQMVRGILTELIGKEDFEKFLVDKEFDFSYGAEGGDRFRGNAFFNRVKSE
jgi:twitching motility protein PilT